MTGPATRWKARSSPSGTSRASCRAKVCPTPDLYTIGHSTRAIEEFVAMLQAHGIERLVDVRTVPRSARNPQYNRESLPASLGPVAYEHMASLGGLRHPRKDSINSAWRNDSFRGYADYMQTREFADAIDKLEVLAAERRTVVMCAEAVPWRCHRSMIADAFTARGHRVFHIMSAEKANPHRMTPYAVTDGPRVWYPGVDSPMPPP